MLTDYVKPVTMSQNLIISEYATHEGLTCSSTLSPLAERTKTGSPLSFEVLLGVTDVTYKTTQQTIDAPVENELCHGGVKY